MPQIWPNGREPDRPMEVIWSALWQDVSRETRDPGGQQALLLHLTDTTLGSRSGTQED
jgi:hypothetical protein